MFSQRQQTIHPVNCLQTVRKQAVLCSWGHSNIRNLPQNRRPLRSRCRGHISRQPMPCLPGKKRKGRCLLCLCGKAEIINRCQLASQRLKPLRQHRHQRAIARPAARNDVVGPLPAPRIFL